jgi:outer membrane murein-binding lipoprotein Lpp
MRVFLMAVVVSGCVAGGSQARRWPDHRKQGDARFTELEQRTHDLEAKLDALTKQLAATQAQLATLAAAPQPPAETSR